MMCMFDIFKNCLILRHRRSHDITVVPSTKGSFGLTRSSSTTSIISCTKKQDDLPPLGTLPRNTAYGNGPSELLTNNAATWPISLISAKIPEAPSLPARPNSIVGLPSIPEISKTKPAERAVNGITVIPDYSEPLGTSPIEPEYSEPLDSIDSALPAERIYPDDDDYPYHDIYEEIRHRDHSREDSDLPDVVTSAYASGEQVYQELLDLVKEEEIKEEKRRSQLFLTETRGSSANSLDDGSDGSSLAESNATNENRDHLQDLYAVPKRNRSDGPRLPPRRVKSSYNRDPNWAPKVPEKSSLLRRSLSDAGGENEGNHETKETHQQHESPEQNERGCDERTHEVTAVAENGIQSRSADHVSAVTNDADAVKVATTTIVIENTKAESPAVVKEVTLYEESHVRNDRLI